MTTATLYHIYPANEIVDRPTLSAMVDRGDPLVVVAKATPEILKRANEYASSKRVCTI